MNARARLLLLTRITGQALAAADAGAFSSPAGSLFYTSALFHDSAHSNLARLGNTAAATTLISQDGQPCRTLLQDATERRQGVLLRVADSSAATAPLATLCSLRGSTVRPPPHHNSWQHSFASQADSSGEDASSNARRGRSDAVPTAAEHSAKHSGAAHSHSGWTRREVWNVPNAISMARLFSGPVIAHWIIAGRMDAALLGLVISGWSDWLDGFMARRLDQQSTLGSYLDPLADKVLICSVVAALGVQGTLPGYLACAILGRDAFLIVASLAARAHSLGWRRVSIGHFFRIVPRHPQGNSGAASDVQGAGAVTPLYISKVNTVLQLATVAGFLLHAHTGWPPLALLDVAAIVTTSTTVLSGAAYVQAFRTGRH